MQNHISRRALAAGLALAPVAGLASAEAPTKHSSGSSTTSRKSRTPMMRRMGTGSRFRVSLVAAAAPAMASIGAGSGSPVDTNINARI